VWKANLIFNIKSQKFIKETTIKDLLKIIKNIKMANLNFCPKCGKPLHVKSEQDKKIAECSCGFTKIIGSDLVFSTKNKKVTLGKGVISREEDLDGFPHICEKCGHPFSEVHDLGAPYSDESNIYLFKCKKCGHVSRQADGSGNK